jgi:hypothetical protein
LPTRTDERAQKRAGRYKQGVTQTIRASVVITKLVIKSAKATEKKSLWQIKVSELHRAHQLSIFNLSRPEILIAS